MKKKLAALNIKLQFGIVGVILLLLGVGGYMLVISPQHAQAAKVQKQVEAEQNQIALRQAALRRGLRPPEIKTADLFRLARAMPDRDDMPGIILTLSQVAREAGIKFQLLEPTAAGAVSTGSYRTVRLHLLFNGDFYGLSDFLYRVRNLVTVRDGTLDATGRLFNVDTVTFNTSAIAFPEISADLDLDAYVYADTAPAATAPPATTTTTTTTPDATDLPENATAAGANP
jgi:Tfp pilus assembly protein PilO